MEAGMADWQGAIGRAEAHSGYLARQLDGFPHITALLRDGDIDAAWAAARAAGEAAADVGVALRREKRALSLVIAIADLAGAWPLETVTQHLSDFADSALDRAIAAAFEERYPGEPVQGLAVLALGKHGSQELNYSSDIDPILLFDPERLPRRPREDPGEAALRLARRVVSLISERDAEGYVFRVDLRLRPSPDATPIILPADVAISYYESLALGWEQAAFIRARAAAGDRALGEYFLQAIRPFVWRRSLDFGAIDAIMDISRRIRDHYASGQALGPGFDLKRGRGGIREVEFFAQIHQLVHGGRNPELREGATLPALRALAEWSIIDVETASRLAQAYRVLREVEHRLQMVDDRQTHELPVNPASLDNAARLHGLADGAALVAQLRPHVEWVGNNYDRLSPFQPGERLSHDTQKLAGQLTELGFPDVRFAVTRIEKWRHGSVRALRSAPAIDALEKLLLPLFKGLARAPDPIIALNRFEALIERLPTAINFFKLLLANRPVLGLLMDILCYAPPLADDLARRVDLLDSLIGSSALEPLPPIERLEALFARRERGDDYQMLLDRVRQKVGESRFSLGVQILRRTTDPLDAAAGYARVADAAVEVLTRETVAEFEKAHGRVPGGELVILALGRLGGGLLTHASDLDLVFLFTGDFRAESEGPKKLGATQYFNWLAQRVGNALSVSTASGPLYEVDTRLRPSGNQGLLAVSFESFVRYQAEAAWDWEHLALTRARPVYGSAAARAELQEIVTATLTAPRDTDALARAAVKMRGDIARHKPPRGPLDVKLVSGGLIDLEFFIHVTQFRSGQGFAPDLRSALDGLAAVGLLDRDLRAAHDLLTRYLVVSRLVTPGSDEPPPESRFIVARACGAGGWPDLLARIEDARQIVAAAWGEVVHAFAGDESDADDRSGHS